MSSYKHGRKIKHRRKIYKKKKKHPVLSATVTVVLTVVIVFLGYSIGEPVVSFLKNNDNDEKVTEFEPEITTEESTEPAQTTSNTTETEKISNESTVWYFSTSTPDDMETLTAEIEIAKQSGANTFAVVLKQQGGTIHYKSEIASIQGSNIIVGQLTAKEIVDVITNNEMRPVAIIDVLYDNLVPRVIEGTGYTFENQSTTWLDNKASSGGKPWTSPFSNKTKEYIGQIVDEAMTSGFKDVIAKNIIFPPFRNSDLNYIGSSVEDENRYTSLVSMMDIIKSKVTSKEGTAYLYVDATKVIDGTQEVFVPEQLQGVKFITEITKSTFKDEDVSSSSTQNIISKLKELALENEILIRTSKADFSDEELEIIQDVCKENNINCDFKS